VFRFSNRIVPVRTKIWTTSGVLNNATTVILVRIPRFLLLQLPTNGKRRVTLMREDRITRDFPCDRHMFSKAPPDAPSVNCEGNKAWADTSTPIHNYDRTLLLHRVPAANCRVSTGISVRAVLHSASDADELPREIEVGHSRVLIGNWIIQNAVAIRKAF
jgi:hypothetical protein